VANALVAMGDAAVIARQWGEARDTYREYLAIPPMAGDQARRARVQAAFNALPAGP